ANPDRLPGGVRRDGLVPVPGVLRLPVHAPRDDPGAREDRVVRPAAGAHASGRPSSSGMSARATLKACFEAGLVRSGVPALNRAARARRGLVLAYHNVVPDSSPGFGDRSLHLPRGLFMRQLESLLATHTVVPLEQVLDAPVAGRRPRAAITFDDGYRGAVLLGVAELAKRGVPETLFVVPSFVGKGPFWWDALAAERSEEHTSELQSPYDLVCRLLLEKKKHI